MNKKIIAIPLPRVVRKTMNLFSDIDVSYSQVLRKLIKNPPDSEREIGAGHPNNPSYRKIKESIEKVGWIPDYRGTSYNVTDTEYPHHQPAMLQCDDNISGEKPRIGSSTNNRGLVLYDLDYKKADFFIQYGSYYVDQPTFDFQSFLNPLGLAGNVEVLQKFHVEGYNFDHLRDNCIPMIQGANVNLRFFFAGKTVLDIGTNAGWWAIAAKWFGADKVYAFDRWDNLVDVAKKMAEVHETDIDFSSEGFWKYPFQQYDVVMANQCIYHMNLPTANPGFDGKKTKYDVLDIVCEAAKETLMMYTEIIAPGREDKREPHRYMPTEEELRQDLSARGFKEIYINDPIGHSKKMVVAHKVPNLFANGPEKTKEG